jgi:hypothetical protein
VDNDVGEQFTQPEPNVIQSTNGFSVKVLGRTGMRYTEGKRSVWIDSEILATESPAIALHTESIRVWEGPEPLVIDAQEKVRIVEDIRRSFAAFGYVLEVQGPFDWSTVALRPPRKQG